jgi:DNA-binding transcriptional LysR family regulator
VNLRHLRYFVALARERHYGRAAAACHVTQPTLSEAIRQLEAELGVPLVERGAARFRGLTGEGDRALGWMQRMLADEEALIQDLKSLKDGLSGTLRFGVIPAAMPVTPFIVTPFTTRYPGVTVELRSMSSIEIQRGLDAFELEVGLTYLENEPLAGTRPLPLYRETYVLLVPAGSPFGGRAAVSWRDAARQRLCLLSRDMQNRRIIDRLFWEGGAEPPRAAMEANSFMALCAHVRQGPWCSIVPSSFLAVIGTSATGVTAIPLIEPDASQAIGLVVADREPLPSLARAIFASAAEAGVAPKLAALLPARSSGSPIEPHRKSI